MAPAKQKYQILLKQHLFIWIPGLLAIVAILLLTPVDPFDIVAEIVFLLASLSVILEMSRLKLGWRLIIGWFMVATSLLLDLADELPLDSATLQLIDDIEEVFRFGFLLLCVSFIAILFENKTLISNLKMEIIQKRRLERKLQIAASQDPLTGLANRRAFFERFDKECHHNPYLIYFDLDNFKQVNDLYGHGKGDEVLQKIATAMKQVLDEDSFGFRLGGDEFVILSNNQDPHKIIEDLENVLHPVFTPYQMGFSTGVIKAEHGDLADDLLNRADCKMYQDKKGKTRARG